MTYRFFLIFIVSFLVSCETIDTNKKINLIKKNKENIFTNKGFALVYNESLFKEKIINKKMNDKDLLIFQRNLKTNTRVLVTNIDNKKSIIAKVGSNSKYPYFYNSVISPRISNVIKLNMKNPYVEIKKIDADSTFIAKSSKTFDEEKSVATKVPVEKIKIKDLSTTKIKTKESKNEFNYAIFLADFYFKNSSDFMVQRIKNNTSINNINVSKIRSNQYRVTIGPFKDLNSLKNSFNELRILEFENIEIIKN